ncbi:hypothetical protein ACJZ2D_015222 [Fusarium nematophilum]
MACKACRARKIRCDRARPVCQNCKHRATPCTYAGERRTKHWAGAGIIRNPREFMSTSTPDGSDPPQDPALSDFEFAFPGETWQSPQEQTATINNITSSHCPPIDLDSMTAPFPHMAYDTGHVLQTPPSSNMVQDGSLLDKILDGHDTECLKDPNPALWMRGSDGDEYTGPSSGITAISDMGLNWVRQNVADSDVLCETIQEIRNGVFNHLRHPKCMPRGLSLEPPTPFSLDDIPRSDIQRYIDVYFSDVQILFPILDRQRLLTQLSTFGTSSDGQRHSWMALLNAVLASGCRAALSDETGDAFRTSGCEAWRFFQSALSFEKRIIHDATDLLAVQAVAVMTVFAQGLSCPQRLEWTLSSIASRLAHSLALNRHPAPEWNLAEDEKQERNRVFWVIFCLDKMIALRSGRPPVICDDDISCCFPRGVEIIQREGGTPADTAPKPPSFDLFLCLARLARICGDVSRRLYSAAALYMPASGLLGTLDRLLQDLESWLQMIPARLRPGKPMARMVDTGGLSRAQIIILQSSYYYVLCATYRRFTPMFSQDDRSLEHLVDRRSHVSHIRAARCIALLTKHLDMESHTPAWLVFYYPFTALTTIFVHTVSNPPSELTQRDIALMETVVGFFGRLEYVTAGETAFTKTTEFVRLARRVTANYGNEACSGRNNTSPAESHTSNNPTTDAERSSQDRTEAGDEQVGTPECFTDGLYHDQSTNASRMIGAGSIPGIPSPKTGLSDGVQRSEPGAGSHVIGMGMMNQNQPLDKELLSILAFSPSDMHPSHWLGDWVSTG